jgi:hypothetical protein
MAVRTGVGGSVTMGDTSGASIAAMTIRKWTADFPREEADVTGFQPTNNLRKSVGGNMEISGSFEGDLDDTADFDQTDIVSATAEFVAAATITLQYNREDASGLAGKSQEVTFSGYLSGVSIGVRVGEPNSISARFIGTGAATWQQKQ